MVRRAANLLEVDDVEPVNHFLVESLGLGLAGD